MEQVLFDNVVGPVVKYLTGHIRKHLGYATGSTKHVNTMRNKMKDLDNKIAEVNKHTSRNNINSREIPTGVPDWLNDVDVLKKKVQSTSNDHLGCLNLKMRYRAGKKACEDTKTIEELITKYSGFDWTDALIPTRMLDSEPTPALSSSHGDDFKSREKTFNDALKFLQQDNNKSQVVALCGIGGVGKTTMMEQLKAHEDVKKLYQIVKVVIGEKPNVHSVQNDIALGLGGERPQEETVAARADSLRRKFNEMLKNEENGKKLLLILDDVWQGFKLKDIGLPSPLPDSIKLLLTSRSSDVCKQIASGLVLKEVAVNLLDEEEAQNFFSRTTGVSEKDDHDLYKIGCDIAKKCGGLPFAIDLIGRALKYKEIIVWRTTLTRLKNNNFDDEVQEIVKISYEHIKEDEEKEIFLHCSLFPEDFNIPIEDLTRCAWGLELLEDVSTLGEARDRTYACVKNLIDANLLMSSDRLGCVKVHDIVLSFMLGEVSKTWIVKHGSASKWSRDEISKSRQRISLTCTSMSEIPTELKYQNPSLLQLMDGDLSLKFREDFYENMENLKVIAYYEMHYPLLPRSLQCSTNLKSLCLYGCKLMFDYSFVGELVNLEVLSFAKSGIRRLPSTVGNLRKLKLLDLTGCAELHIDDGVFKSLENLEELYMRLAYGEEKGIRFTDSNFKELKMLSKHLSALEVEFVEEVAQLKNVCFTELYKFKIAIGCVLEDIFDKKYSFENTLKLVVDRKSDLLDSKIDILFKKTEDLRLKVKDMIRLEDIVSVHPYDQRLFCKLKNLEVFNCANLKYLFPMSVASGLTTLEHLKISSCPVLETLVQNYGSEINNVGDMIKFGKLKSLSFKKLPKLASLFLVDSVVELPQLVELEVDGLPNFTSIYHDKNNIPALLNSQVRISELKKLKIKSMKNLKQIWDVSDQCSEESVHNTSMLREIWVEGCDSLVNVLPNNRMQLLNHLERLEVERCGSIEVIFNNNMECVGQVSGSEKVTEAWRMKSGENIIFEKLKFMSLKKLPKLVSLFLTDNVIELPQLVELKVDGLPNFTSIYPDKNNNYASQQPFFNSQIKASKLKTLEIKSMGNLKHIWALSNQSSDEDANNISMLREIWVEGCDSFVNLFPTNPMRLLNHLESLTVKKCRYIEKIFNIDMGCVGEVEQVSKSRLRNILVDNSENLIEVWSIKGGENNSSSSPIHGFEAVESINIRNCKRFRNLFTPTNTGTITNFGMRALTKISIDCSSARQEDEVRKERDNDISAAVAFPSNLIHSFPNLQELSMYYHKSVEVVFEIESSPISRELVTNLQSLDLKDIERMSHVWRCSNWNTLFILQKQSPFHNLTTIKMWSCKRIKYLFSPLMAKLLSNLKTIAIKWCDDMEEVVSKRDDKDEEEITTSTTTFFPHLHSLTFSSLNNLKRIGGGGAKSTTSIIHDQFKVVPWYLCQYSEEIVIDFCGSLMEVFETQEINNSTGGGITSTTTVERNGTNNTSLANPRLERINVPRLSNLKKLEIGYCDLLQHVFTFSTLESLEKLEELMIKDCEAMKVIVRKESGEQRKVVKFPCLKSLELQNLPNFKGFFLGMNEFQWPSLEKVLIDYCPKMMVFTCGQSTTPELKYIHTSLGKHSLECDLNSYLTGVHQTSIPTSESSSLERLPAWSYHNLIDLSHTECVYDCEVKCIISSSELLQLQKLERVQVYGCDSVEEIFEVEAMDGTSSEEEEEEESGSESSEVEAMEGTNSEEEEEKEEESGLEPFEVEAMEGANSEESQTVVQVPNLTLLELELLPSLKYIWKSNHNGRRVLEFPNLTTLYIDRCHILKHVFTSSMVGSLQKLQDLHISHCYNLAVIVKQEEEFECDTNVKETLTFPFLKSLKLEYLSNLEGFWLGKDDFPFPSLRTLEIEECPQLTVFTSGHK